jgi:hypothetical protein
MPHRFPILYYHHIRHSSSIGTANKANTRLYDSRLNKYRPPRHYPNARGGLLFFHLSTSMEVEQAAAFKNTSCHFAKEEPYEAIDGE